MKNAAALPIEKVGEVWQKWQNANREEAAVLRNKFADLAIYKGFGFANGWLVKQINIITGLPEELIREYQWIHRND